MSAVVELKWRVRLKLYLIVNVCYVYVVLFKGWVSVCRNWFGIFFFPLRAKWFAVWNVCMQFAYTSINRSIPKLELWRTSYVICSKKRIKPTNESQSIFCIRIFAEDNVPFRHCSAVEPNVSTLCYLFGLLEVTMGPFIYCNVFAHRTKIWSHQTCIWANELCDWIAKKTEKVV